MFHSTILADVHLTPTCPSDPLYHPPRCTHYTRNTCPSASLPPSPLQMSHLSSSHASALQSTTLTDMLVTPVHPHVPQRPGLPLTDVGVSLVEALLHDGVDEGRAVEQHALVVRARLLHHLASPVLVALPQPTVHDLLYLLTVTQNYLFITINYNLY